MILTEIFCHIDDFCKEVEQLRLVSKKKSNKGRPSKMLKCEILTIIIFFPHSKFITFKDYYNKFIKIYLYKAFTALVSYNRFVELMKDYIFDLYLFLQLHLGKSTGISFIDSFAYKVCHSKRSYSHKVFKGIAKKGKSSVGWFFGLKVHAVINHIGEIIDFCITTGSMHDANLKIVDFITKKINGKLFGDRGYISKKLWNHLYSKGIILITKLKKNMKNKLMNFEDKILLNKRGVIESVFSKLKEGLRIEHSRHRSTDNFIVNLLAGLSAYFFEKKKPSILGGFEPKLKAF